MKKTFKNLTQTACLLALTLVFGAFGAGAARAATYTVTNLNDSGAGSLRQAIIDANASTEDDVINFSVTGTIALTSGELSITGNGALTINGPGAGSLTVSGSGASRVFFINSNTNTAISGLTISGGNGVGPTEPGQGGGIRIRGTGTASITGSIISNNTAGVLGGGIASQSSTLNLVNSTVSGNSASFDGGGIYNLVFLNVTNSTVSGNSASGGSSARGGGIYNQGTLMVNNSTVSGNSASSGGGIYNSFILNAANTTISGNSASSGGGIDNDIGTSNLMNSIIADSVSGGDCLNNFGTVNASYCLVEDGTCGVANGVNNNKTGDPKLAPLGSNGGSTLTHALTSGSPAIDAGSDCVLDQTCPTANPPAALTTDQRGAGFPRKVGSSVDIGAFEAPASLVVKNTLDSGAGSLRAAISAANSDPAYDAITFDIPATDPGCQNRVCTITLTSGELAIAANSALVINGTGANFLRVSGNNASRVLNVGGNAHLTLNDLTVTGGRTNGFGGGILNNSGSTLTINNSAVSGNSSIPNYGGGIYNQGGSSGDVTTLNINNSTVSNNSAIYGGGIYNGGGFSGSTTTVNIFNSTISGNSAYDSNGAVGGGIYNGGGLSGSTTTVNIFNSTISGNSAGTVDTDTARGGGISNIGLATVNAGNTIIAGNSVFLTLFGGSAQGPDVFGTLTSQGYNLIGNTADANITGDTTGNILNQPALLAPLGNYGGQTMTHALTSGSPAIDAGSDCVLDQTCPTANPPAALTTDQRGAGFPRKVGSSVDIGAFEVQVVTAAGTTVSGRAVNSSGRVVSRARITLTNQHGEIRTAATNHFGFYRFENVEAGQTVILTIESKRQQFEEPVRVIFVTGEMNEVNFTAVQQKSLRN